MSGAVELADEGGRGDSPVAVLKPVGDIVEVGVGQADELTSTYATGADDSVYCTRRPRAVSARVTSGVSGSSGSTPSARIGSRSSGSDSKTAQL